MTASASLECQVRTLQSALVTSRGQVHRLEGELARSSAGQEGLRRRVLRLERDLLTAGVCWCKGPLRPNRAGSAHALTGLIEAANPRVDFAAHLSEVTRTRLGTYLRMSKLSPKA